MRRSTRDLIGYTIHATDGEIGKVNDIYFDDHTWAVRYLVVRAGRWLSARKVLISPVAAGKPDWRSRTLPVALTASQVCHSPDIDADKPVSRQHEAEVHYLTAWPAYWTGQPHMMGICGPLPMLGMDRDLCCVRA